MNVKDKVFVSGNIKAPLKTVVIDMLNNMPSQQGVEAAKEQVALAEKLEACEGGMDVTPEEAVLIRSLINRAAHLPPTIQVGMYDAFDSDSQGDIAVAVNAEPTEAVDG